MEVTFIILISILLFAELGRWIWSKVKTNKLEQQVREEKTANAKILHQKKSSEVILGQVAEKLVPFTDLFNHDPQKATFLGNPIDYIVFEEDEIIFIEVKSGNSRLSNKQKLIRNLVENKQVRWEEIKIKP